MAQPAQPRVFAALFVLVFALQVYFIMQLLLMWGID